LKVSLPFLLSLYFPHILATCHPSFHFFSTVFQLESLGLDDLRNVFAQISSSSSKATEMAVTCVSPFLPDGVDDVSALSIAVDLEGGYRDHQLEASRMTLTSDRRRLTRETRKLTELEESIEKLKEKEEEEARRKEEQDNVAKSKASQLADKLKKLRDRDRKLRSKIDEQGEDDFPDTFGIIEDYFRDTDTEKEGEDGSNRKDLEAQVEEQRKEVNELKLSVEELEKSIEEKDANSAVAEKEWRGTKVKEYISAMGLDKVHVSQGLADCIFTVALNATKCKMLLKVRFVPLIFYLSLNFTDILLIDYE
jgi:hypothetical protein